MALKQQESFSAHRLEQAVLARVEAVLSSRVEAVISSRVESVLASRLDTAVNHSIGHRQGAGADIPFNWPFADDPYQTSHLPMIPIKLAICQLSLSNWPFANDPCQTGHLPMILIKLTICK